MCVCEGVHVLFPELLSELAIDVMCVFNFLFYVALLD